MKLIYGLLLSQEHECIYACVVHACTCTHTRQDTTYIYLFHMVQRKVLSEMA